MPLIRPPLFYITLSHIRLVRCLENTHNMARRSNALPRESKSTNVRQRAHAANLKVHLRRRSHTFQKNKPCPPALSVRIRARNMTQQFEAGGGRGVRNTIKPILLSEARSQLRSHVANRSDSMIVGSPQPSFYKSRIYRKWSAVACPVLCVRAAGMPDPPSEDAPKRASTPRPR